MNDNIDLPSLETISFMDNCCNGNEANKTIDGDMPIYRNTLHFEGKTRKQYKFNYRSSISSITFVRKKYI